VVHNENGNDSLNVLFKDKIWVFEITLDLEGKMNKTL